VIGKTLGSYRVVDRLGEGGMGAVYIAEHPLIGRKAAVKVLLPQFSNNKEIVDRFFNEARAATMVKHGGIIDIFDFGYSEDGSAFIVMEYLDGQSLTDRIGSAGRLTEADGLRLARQAAGALAAAHEAGIVHRDLKPDNIFVIPDSEVIGGERVKILDFGIAKLTRETEDGIVKTRTGTVMGSPLYMAPEQCRGAGDADARADVYALGCVVYHMLCGRPPFDGAGAGEVLAKHIYEPVLPPRTLVPELGPAVEAFILQCLAKKPEERFQSMSAVVATLDQLTSGRFASGAALPAYHTPPVGVPRIPTPPPGDLPVAQSSGATTLGNSSGQVVGAVDTVLPPGRGKRASIAVAGILLAGAAVTAIVLASGGDDTRDTAADLSDPEPEEPLEPQPPAAELEPEPEEPAMEPPTAEPEKVTLEVASVPERALVRDERGVLLGETPYKAVVDRGETAVVFVLQKAGHEEVRVDLIPDVNRSETVELPKEQRAAAGGSSTGSRASKKKTTSTTTTTQTTPTTGDKRKSETTGSGFGKTVDPFKK
jgi:eukaryotic-like serine/threonine-protein kinase